MATMTTGAQRVDWVDAAKGMCIIFVVMMHSTIGVGLAMGGEGFMHWVVSFARPFRMPDFFLISGLFLGLVIDRPLRRYVDRKVVHFAYFYVLWLTIQFVFKAPGIAMEDGAAAALTDYLLAFVEPFGTLWFIYILPVFFMVTRMVRSLPVRFVFAWAALLEMLPVHTGWLIFDEFCARYVYFFAGYAFATRIFAIAEWLRAYPGRAFGILALWAPVNAALVFAPAPAALTWLIQPETGFSGQTGGWSELPLVSLALGLAGALAICSLAALVARLRGAAWLTWLGAHSIVVYLAFFLPMAVSRAILVKTGIVTDPGLVSLMVTTAGVVGPVLLYGLIHWSGYGRFLFERPSWAFLDRPGEPQDRARADRPISA
ncbi:MAG: acyltransferase family protein [Rhizobiaceae bacterium]|nr:acyltransferase family protein [Rhizobiaceae bacterium]MCV0406005.1 acyltransferase family protein [Rhizobiaceae bacterium]